MNGNSPAGGRVELSLVPLPPTPKDTSSDADERAAAALNAERDGVPDSADRFLARATREYVKGHIDQPLWLRAVAQSGGDETLARAGYLRARATAMRLADREKRADGSAGDARRAQGAEAPEAGSESRDAPARHQVRRAGADPKRKYLMALGAIVGLVAIGMWWMVTPKESVSALPSGVAAGTPASGGAAPAAPPGNRQTIGAGASRAADQEDLNQYFAEKVQELRHAGNWNVLVLYAAEWSRKRPENGLAWKELSIGYANMRQLDDAYTAARKAVQFAPADSGSWRNLGQVNLALEQPAAALAAFEQAVAVNDQDLQSLVQVGVLNTQLGRLPAARVAFERVLAVSPENVDALCGEATIAQKEGRLKDADALARQLQSVDRKCRDWNDGGHAPVARSVATSSVKTPASVPASSPRRQAR